MGTTYPAPKNRKIIFYALDLLLIFVPLGGLLYFMFDPPAFDAFLDWTVSSFEMRGGQYRMSAAC